MFGTTRPPHLPRLPCERTRNSEPSDNVLSLNEPPTNSELKLSRPTLQDIVFVVPLLFERCLEI